jgi:pimeloyl-ACP methyl ester carboxylesterase
MARGAPLPLRLLFWIGGILLPDAIGGFIARRMFRPRRRATEMSALLASVRQRCLRSGQEQVPYWLWSRPGARSTALLVHGWEGSADDLTEFVPALSRQGFNVVAFDAPAHARASGTTTDVRQMAEAVAAVIAEMAALELPVRAVVAHSLGAAAVTIALADGRACIDRLVMLAPAGEIALEVEKIRAALWLPAAALRALIARVEQRYGQPLQACSTAATAKRLPMPVLVIHDRDDPLTPLASAQALAAAIPRARLTITQGLGHRRILGDPAVLAQVAVFCAEVREKRLCA